MDSKGLRLLRIKLAMMPRDYFQSKDGRSLLARILRTVRAESGRQAAKEVRNDILIYSVLP